MTEFLGNAEHILIPHQVNILFIAQALCETRCLRKELTTPGNNFHNNITKKFYLIS
jgi:hypothetical protein